MIGLVREASPAAIRDLIRLGLEAKDERVRVVACSKVCDIAQLPKLKPEPDRPRPDLSALTPKELEQFAKLLGKAAKAGGLPAATT